ncbi:Na+/H+ antiporter subunit E [Thalassolituus marinus]|uniref:Na+/H+ antiporter subunit E n=1 Tax=Thalassolituus marinus TaxID=671053 RepID=A0ABS7ZNS6_9GAMM|nr:Na+/H+ antiporter subunit E [Thalassolituus marinus]MCA6062717.1 Na+/H+ antiporter subunit E [Thalassolituus marinus]
MRYILPMPVHSLMLLAVWLLLNGFSVGQLVLGLILAWLIPVITWPYTDHQSRAGKPLKIAAYVARLLRDIVVSNVDVALKVLGSNRSLNPGFICYPLALQGDFPLTVLASTISLTPGTVSVDFSEDRKWLYVHALHITTEQEMIAEIRQRYEQPLQEIFS